MTLRLVGFAFVSFLLLFAYWTTVMFVRGELHKNPAFALSCSLFITILTVLGATYILARAKKTHK